MSVGWPPSPKNTESVALRRKNKNETRKKKKLNLNNNSISALVWLESKNDTEQMKRE